LARHGYGHASILAPAEGSSCQRFLRRVSSRFTCLFKAFSQYCLGAGMTFAATGSNIKLGTQFEHRGKSVIDGTTNFMV
jgi:hypothetical protein